MPDDERIAYVINPRAKNISLKMDTAKRQMIVTASSKRALPAARRFVSEKADWIIVHLERLPAAQPYVHEGYILYRGEMTQIINPGGRGAPKFREGDDLNPPRLIIPAPDGALEGRAKRFLIRQAREAVEACTHYHASQLDVGVSKVSVRDTRSRWGSCAPGGIISYSWRLVCAPPYVLDYVCAHEVSHIIEANHSRAFWDVVDGLVDSVKPAKKWLRDNAAELHAVGANF